MQNKKIKLKNKTLSGTWLVKKLKEGTHYIYSMCESIELDKIYLFDDTLHHRHENSIHLTVQPSNQDETNTDISFEHHTIIQSHNLWRKRHFQNYDDHVHDDYLKKEHFRIIYVKAVPLIQFDDRNDNKVFNNNGNEKHMSIHVRVLPLNDEGFMVGEVFACYIDENVPDCRLLSFPIVFFLSVCVCV